MFLGRKMPVKNYDRIKRKCLRDSDCFVSEEKNVIGWLQSKQLQAAFIGKASTDEIMVILRDVPNPLDDDEATYNPIAIDIFSQTIFMLGSKSISHCQTAIAKYQSVFKVLFSFSSSFTFCGIVLNEMKHAKMFTLSSSLRFPMKMLRFVCSKQRTMSGRTIRKC
jgi:hypothetical protein